MKLYQAKVVLCASPEPSREKANLALTLANRRDDVVAHASFLDHPIAGLVDQARWETFLKENFAAQQCTVSITMSTLGETSETDSFYRL